MEKLTMFLEIISITTFMTATFMIDFILGLYSVSICSGVFAFLIYKRFKKLNN